VVTTRAYAGTHSLLVGGTTSSTQSATQQVTIPATGSSQTLTFRTYVTTSESGSTAYDKLNIQANGTTLKTYSNASTRGSWFSTTLDLSAYAGQTVTLKFQAVNDYTLPTSFYVDVVSVLA
jgi:kumamolisin